MKILSLLLLCCLNSAVVMGQHLKSDRASKNATSGGGKRVASAGKEIVVNGRTLFVPDIWVVTQDGKRVRFYSDLIKDKSVALGFFFTSCVFVCTRHGELFSSFQKHVSDRLGKEVFLISVSMDPKTDTPSRLRKWGTTYRRRDGWTLVTGKPGDLDELVRTLTGNTVGPREAHSSLFYIANGKTGQWSYMLGYPTAAEFVQQIEDLGIRQH
jgi:protein SCO1